MNITKEQAIELAKEADKDLPRDDWNQIAFVLGEAALHRLCNLAVKHAAKDVEPFGFFEYVLDDADGYWRETEDGEDGKPLYTHPTHDDTSLLRQALKALNLAHPYIQNKAEREQSWAAFTALRERLGDKT